MEKEEMSFHFKQEQFFDLIKKAYEKGLSDQDMTVEKLLRDLKIGLENSALK
ncbi:hypothetical protein [Mesobacillus foraminis]|uniref:hypothetical protein n=1 Tax=Mesobacillus foraminis TaxID=279826 RepID=UPI0013CF1D31|nr:hypothetical protein [Mesobacillus foraminis]